MGSTKQGMTDGGFAERYREVAPALYAWIAVRLGPALRRELDAEDVLQEVACRAYAKRGSYDEDQAPFRSWLFGIARNVLLQSMEQLTGRGRPDRDWLTTGGLARVPEDATSVTRRVACDDLVAAFLDGVASMAEEDRDLVVLRGLEGKSHEEVGAAMGLEPSTAAKRWERLLVRLRSKYVGLELVP